MLPEMSRLPGFPTVWEPHSTESLVDLSALACLNDPRLLGGSELPAGVRLPAPLCERLVRLCARRRPPPEVATLEALFGDPERTRLERLDLSGWDLAGGGDGALETAVRHPLRQLELARCVGLQPGALARIGTLGSTLRCLSLPASALEDIYTHRCVFMARPSSTIWESFSVTQNLHIKNCWNSYPLGAT